MEHYLIDAVIVLWLAWLTWRVLNRPADLQSALTQALAQRLTGSGRAALQARLAAHAARKQEAQAGG